MFLDIFVKLWITHDTHMLFLEGKIKILKLQKKKEENKDGR